ncbi:MAG: endo-1,3-alpha-glucanase family glycosylhydrolase [Caldilineaceae bacterium]
MTKNYPKRIVFVRLGITVFALCLLMILLVYSTSSGQDHQATQVQPQVLAAYQAWFGLEPHKGPYNSKDANVISHHIDAARAQGIDAFVVDWYGKPQDGLTNSQDRAFIDEVTAELLRQAQEKNFKVALMYDAGSIRNSSLPTSTYMSQVITDIGYATKYLTMTSYLTINAKPAVFVFPDDNVDQYLDWSKIRAALKRDVILLDKDPREGHVNDFDGFYAWVTADKWQEKGEDYGAVYLDWFYKTMSSNPYTNEVAVGGVWKGFDNAEAPWIKGREVPKYIWPRCGQVWHNTWNLAKQNMPPYVLISTWNDFEEKTDIEFGAGDCLKEAQSQCVSPRQTLTFTYTLANTGKFTDTFSVEVQKPADWGSFLNPSEKQQVAPYSRIPLTLTLQIASNPVHAVENVVLTATSGISNAVYTTLVNKIHVPLCTVYLPTIAQEPNIHIVGPRTVNSRVSRINGALQQVIPGNVTIRVYAQEGEKYWCIQPAESAAISDKRWTAELQLGAPGAFGVFAVLAEGNGNQLPGCTSSPNYITASNEEEFDQKLLSSVYSKTMTSISPRFEITRTE